MVGKRFHAQSKLHWHPQLYHVMVIPDHSRAATAIDLRSIFLRATFSLYVRLSCQTSRSRSACVLCPGSIHQWRVGQTPMRHLVTEVSSTSSCFSLSRLQKPFHLRTQEVTRIATFFNAKTGEAHSSFLARNAQHLHRPICQFRGDQV